MGRVTERLKNNSIFTDLNISDFSPVTDRAMICGSLGLNLEIKGILDDLGFKEGANSEPAEYVVEKAFVG
jgi:ferredoxin--NADP+ reductase